MELQPKIKIYSFTIDCRDPGALAKFYAGLLHYDVVFSAAEWACIAEPGRAKGEAPGILFQLNEDYLPPVWPDEPGRQQQMAHLDLAVDDLDAAVKYAAGCGAVEAEEQFSGDWRVMKDPEGHPFCLCSMKELF